MVKAQKYSHAQLAKGFRLSPKEKSRASTDGVVIISRPQSGGTYGVFAVDISDGSPLGINWYEVDDKTEMSRAVTALNRDLDKFHGRGDAMSSRGRHRPSSKHVATMWLRYGKQANQIHVVVRELPQVLQRALRAVDYNRRDIRVSPATQFTPSEGSAGFEGNRGYVVVVNLKSNQYEVHKGSWGGANPFERRQVDVDDRPQAIPHNGAVIIGESGGRGSFASIEVHPDNLQALLPRPKFELTESEAKALDIIKSLKSSYRSGYFGGALGPYSAENPLLQSLAAKKLIKIDSRGSIQITTEGKNALVGAPGRRL